MAAAPPVYCTDLIVHPTVSSASDTDEIDISATIPNDAKPQTFRGLSNQGATCYMNSLLQTLYMTAEFRHTLYKWTYSSERDGDEQYCIPLQLQKLFGMLQLSSSRAVDTLALTKSFGWEGNERFQQQDVQELCRVLFDALEECFKGHADVENFIDELYAGELVDYIKCMDVDYQSERKDKFLDYSIAIRPFGADVSMKSVTECIEHYLEPEILDGDNQYFCDSVSRKVDAIKGLKFGRLPQLMSVQLKRFVFDFSGDAIVHKKINDKVTFPLILDMNKYVSMGKATGEKSGVGGFDEFLKRRIKDLRAGQKGVEKVDDSDGLPELVDCNGSVMPATEAVDEETPLVEEFFDHSVDPLQLVEEKGEWVYELYAVLVHAGAISGGHYYVFIRDTSTNKWWNFNDSSVTEVSEKTVLEAQGGFTATSSYSGGSYVRYPAVYPARQVESSANAYMLMYRKVTPASMVVDFPGDDLVPGYIRDEVKRITDEAEQMRLANIERMNKITISVLWNTKKYDIATTKTTKYNDFLQQVWLQLPIYDDEKKLFAHILDKDRGTVPLGQLRLRVYNIYHKVPGMPFDVETCGDMTLENMKISLNRELFIEVKDRDVDWGYYEIDGLNIFMTEFDSASNSFKEYVVTRVPRGATVGYLRNLIAPPPDAKPVRIMKMSVWAGSDVKAVEFDNDDLTLVGQLQVFESQRIFWEEVVGPLESSPALEVFKFTTNQISVNLKDGRRTDNATVKTTADKRWNLTQLRSHVATTLSMTEEFRLCKFTPPQAEYNGEESKSLSSLGFYTGMTVVVKPGSPLLPGHFNFKVFMYNSSYHAKVVQLGEALSEFSTTAEFSPLSDGEPASPTSLAEAVPDIENGDPLSCSIAAPPIDGGVEVPAAVEKCKFGTEKVGNLPTLNQFEFLMDYPAHGDALVGDIRAALFERLKTRNLIPESTTIKNVRVRLKNGQACSDILVDSLTLRQSKVAMYADRGLAIQILDHEEDIDPIESGDALVFVRRWLRSSWKLTPPTEILLKGDKCVNEIATALAMQYSIPPSTMKVLVLHPYTDINLYDLDLQAPNLTCEWIDPISETKTLKEVKWHLTYGDCIIIQNTEEPLRVLTKEQEQLVAESRAPLATSDYCNAWWDDAAPASAVSSSNTYSVAATKVGPQPRPRAAQRGIVIKTQKDRELERMQGNTEAVLVQDSSDGPVAPDWMEENGNVGGSNMLFGDVD